MREDWDNLVILDGCRFDVFEKLNYLDGKLEHRISRGSCTNEFLRENFKGRKFNDTIYITANPLINYHVAESFYEIISVWKDGWHREYGTVLPETMVKFSLRVIKEHPNKRLIIHFMQPHYPYIGEESRKKIGSHEGILSIYLFQEKRSKRKHEHKEQLVWNLLKNKKIDEQTVWEAYEENLKIVLKYTKELTNIFKGKTVITSDHGNLFGKRLFPFFTKEYGHPCKVHTKDLIKIPWLIYEKGKRRKIKKSRFKHKEKLPEKEKKDIKKKLESLGYID